MIMRTLALLGTLAVCACDTEPLAIAGIDGSNDLAQTTCGNTTCGANQVCVHPQCADCVAPLDGGTCPDGFTHSYCPVGGPSCVGPYHDVYMNQCADLEPGCSSSNPCDCVATQPTACQPLGSHDVATLCY